MVVPLADRNAIVLELDQRLRLCLLTSTEQRAGIEALQGPQDAVDMMLNTFDERRKLIVKLLNEVPGVSCITPKGAFYAFPNITGTGMKSKQLEELLLEEAGVATVSGTSFGHLGEGYIRFSYASSTENIKEALRRMKDLLSSRKR
jgi:aspartate/methionine/tyrosine aminotransferase